MHERLETARKLASSARFAAEHQAANRGPVERSEREISLSRRMGLEVNAALVPFVHSVVEQVCSRLGISLKDARTFVQPNCEMQASCSASRTHCIIEVSSRLVEVLNADELAFVIGHEVGHFLLDHHFIPLGARESLEHYAMSRAREVSADRFGLMACGSIDHALRAILKTFSGLPEQHLRFDSVAFLGQQFDETNRDRIQASPSDTHPSFPLRARCLIRFSTILDHWGQSDWPERFAAIDEAVLNDFKRFGETVVRERIEEMESDCGFWMFLSAAVQDGVLRRNEKDIITRRFGAAALDGFQRNFANASRGEVTQFVEEKFDMAIARLQRNLPSRWLSIVREMVSECEQQLSLAQGTHLLRRRIPSA